jgi:hypothetical protein
MLAAMSAASLASWLLAVMLTASPPGRSRAPAEARETAAEGRARYERIAKDLAEVALDPAEAPVFSGKNARERTAALMLALAHHESGFRRDVDLGLGRPSRGRYWCMMQVAVDRSLRGGRTPEGWSGPDLVSDRSHCFRAGLHILQRASGRCSSAGPDAWLNLYTSGHCTRGRRASQDRLGTYRRWLGERPFPVE